MVAFLSPLIHSTLREHYILLFGSAGVFALGVGGIGAWVGAYFGARRASRRLAADTQREAARLAEERYASLERGIEAIAIEVERISESQRFTSRVLSERAAAIIPPAPLRREPGTTTPH